MASKLHSIAIRIYWAIIICLCLLLVFLIIDYYRNHYSDPKLHLFQDYIWAAASLNLSQKNQTSFEHCLNSQNISKVYPSSIMQNCLSNIKTILQKEKE